MALSWEALAGIGIAVAMLAAAVYKRLDTRSKVAGTRATLLHGGEPSGSERPARLS